MQCRSHSTACFQRLSHTAVGILRWLHKRCKALNIVHGGLKYQKETVQKCKICRDNSFNSIWSKSQPVSKSKHRYPKICVRAQRLARLDAFKARGGLYNSMAQGSDNIAWPDRSHLLMSAGDGTCEATGTATLGEGMVSASMSTSDGRSTEPTLSGKLISPSEQAPSTRWGKSWAMTGSLALSKETSMTASGSIMLPSSDSDSPDTSDGNDGSDMIGFEMNRAKLVQILVKNME